MIRKPARKKGGRRFAPVSFPAPVAGWVKNQNLASPAKGVPQGAERLINIFPTATGAEVRAGSDKYATLGAGDQDVRAFLRYKNGITERLFAAIDPAIYDISDVVAPDTSPTPVVSGMTSGLWSSVQFATTGAVVLVAVNGADSMRLYDGTYWLPITSSDIYQLAYDNEAAPFTVGATLTGGTSTATAKILAVQDNGSNGLLIISDIAHGTFQNNELLTDSAGGGGQVNGTAAKIFNGVTFEDGTGPVLSMTTADLKYVWTYKSRLFFIEKDSMNFWYASIDQLGGTLKAFPMAGIFSLGGSLMFGASWSLDDAGAGGGLSAQCILVTTEGEVAVFQGDDPDAATWSLVGVYRIGQPLGPNAWHRAGGDLVISTDIGHVPLSQAINRDTAALSPASVSYPIETAWNEAVSVRRPGYWNCVVWPERQMVVVALPTGDGNIPTMFVANARTGAWAEFTGWDGKCLVVYQGRLFFGSAEGRIVEGYVTGLDQGLTYTGVYVPLMSDIGTPGSLKMPNLARAVLRSNSPVLPDVSMQFDFVVDLPPAPNAAVVVSGSVWGDAEWGTDVWGDDAQKITQQDWVSVSGAGYAFAPAMQLTSGALASLATEIIRLDVLYDMGDVLS